MITERQAWKLVAPRRDDRSKIASLLHFSPYVHRHLDWRSPLDWLGEQPYVALREKENYLAALACPLELDGIAWVRLFAVCQSMPLDAAWDALWGESRLALPSGTTVAALPLQSWFMNLLTRCGFVHTHDVIMLSWEDRGQPLSPVVGGEDCRLRLMTFDDLEAVQALDAAAFGLVWRHSLQSLRYAFATAALATVIEDDDGLLAYQLSTINGLKGHLARLAVHPRAQRSGIGNALLNSLLTEFRVRGIRRVTVNTQHTNVASLALYEKNGFRPTDDAYPVLEYVIT